MHRNSGGLIDDDIRVGFGDNGHVRCDRRGDQDRRFVLVHRMGDHIPINNCVLCRNLGIIDGNPTLLYGNDLYAWDYNMNSNRIEFRIWKLENE